jgi:hypothetical protein
MKGICCRNSITRGEPVRKASKTMVKQFDARLRETYVEVVKERKATAVSKDGKCKHR